MGTFQKSLWLSWDEMGHSLSKLLIKALHWSLSRVFWLTLDGKASNESVKMIELVVNNRSSHQRCSLKKGVLRNFTKFTGTHLCQSLFFNKVPGLGPAALLKKSLWHRFFPANLVKFQRTPSLLSTSWRLLLNHTICTWMSLW